MNQRLRFALRLLAGTVFFAQTLRAADKPNEYLGAEYGTPQFLD